MNATTTTPAAPTSTHAGTVFVWGTTKAHREAGRISPDGRATYGGSDRKAGAKFADAVTITADRSRVTLTDHFDRYRSTAGGTAWRYWVAEVGAAAEAAPEAEAEVAPRVCGGCGEVIDPERERWIESHDGESYHPAHLPARSEAATPAAQLGHVTSGAAAAYVATAPAPAPAATTPLPHGLFTILRDRYGLAPEFTDIEGRYIDLGGNPDTRPRAVGVAHRNSGHTVTVAHRKLDASRSSGVDPDAWVVAVFGTDHKWVPDFDDQRGATIHYSTEATAAHFLTIALDARDHSNRKA